MVVKGERKASQHDFHQLVLPIPQVLKATWGDNQERLTSTVGFLTVSMATN